MYRMAAGAEAGSFVVSRRAQEATLQLARQVILTLHPNPNSNLPHPNPNLTPNPDSNPNQVGTVELVCKPAKAGTAHWSAPLPLPDAIAFNVYHKDLACVVANGATGRGGARTLDATSAPDALFVGEAY
eukprot:scaffold106753_cov33-Phaeocystis_antarctica.AAC.1